MHKHPQSNYRQWNLCYSNDSKKKKNSKKEKKEKNISSKKFKVHTVVRPTDLISNVIPYNLEKCPLSVSYRISIRGKYMRV